MSNTHCMLFFRQWLILSANYESATQDIPALSLGLWRCDHRS